MDCYHCEVCDVFIKPRNKSKHFKSNNQQNLDKHKYKKINY